MSEFLYVGGYYAPAHPEFTHVIIADRAVPSCPSGSVSPGHRCAVYPFSSVTDAQWALLEPLLPRPGNTGGAADDPKSTAAGQFWR